MRIHPVLAVLYACVLMPASASSEEEKPIVIQDGSTVSIEYTLKLDDGSTADTNVDGEPLSYEQGKEQILPSLEQELAGLKVNDTKQVTLAPEKGYGEVDPARRHEVEAERIPEGAREAGAELVTEDGNGNRMMVRVYEVKDEVIVLDFNHPLAGETLHFDVKILGIE